MICLNYHRVDSREDADFYTVPPVSFVRHLEEIRKSGCEVVGVDGLMTACSGDKLVMLNFDDGTEDHYNHVLPALEKFGMKGVFFVSTSKIGQAGYITEGQIAEMAGAGHSIECHGHSHRRMDTMASEKLEEELARSVELISKWTGISPRILAPPGGYLFPNIANLAKKHGMVVVRTMKWNTNRLPIGGELDCLVVSGTTSDLTIRNWFEGRGLGKLRAAYFVKQMVRSMVPFDCYLKLRSLLRHR